MTCAPRPTAGIAARIGWLLAGLAAGLLAGLAVRALGGGDIGFLAIPAAVIAGWLRFSDPTACTPRRGARDARDDDAA